MKRRAMVIIIANSCAGIPIRFPGLRSFSSPSVKARGDVVRVKIEVPTMSKISRMASIPPLDRPSLVKVRKLHCQRISPSVMKELSAKVKRIMMMTGLRPRKRKRGGIPERKMASAIYKAARP